MSSRRFEAIGTEWDIETERPITAEVAQAIDTRIALFDKTYSRFRDDSLITAIAKKAGEYTFPADAKALFAFYQIIYKATKGKLTPLVGALLEASGYDAQYNLRQTGPLQTPPELFAVARFKENILTTTSPQLFDFGAAGKGYLADIIGDILSANGHDSYIIDASGDIVCKGASQRIGLEDPRDNTRVIGVVEIKNQSICASAANRRAWGDNLHHIFDPQKRQPVRDIIATWAIAKNGLEADGLATALFFTDPQVLQKSFQFAYVRMRENGEVDYSENFKGEIFG